MTWTRPAGACCAETWAGAVMSTAEALAGVVTWEAAAAETWIAAAAAAPYAVVTSVVGSCAVAVAVVAAAAVAVVAAAAVNESERPQLVKNKHSRHVAARILQKWD